MELLNGHGVRRRGGLRLRPREKDGRADQGRAAEGAVAVQAAGTGYRGHGRHVPLYRAPILVEREYKLDRQYVVRDGEIVIVDEFTGRLAEGRKWREGLHQAVEAKQGVEVTVAAGQAARVTIQDFFLRYERLAGMTGTAIDSAAELRRIYHCHVLPIPTNRPAIRQRLPTQVFGTGEASGKQWLRRCAKCTDRAGRC